MAARLFALGVLVTWAVVTVVIVVCSRRKRRRQVLEADTRKRIATIRLNDEFSELVERYDEPAADVDR